MDLCAVVTYLYKVSVLYVSEAGAVINCPNCGAILPDGALFCMNCGSQLAQQQVPWQPVPQQHFGPSKKVGVGTKVVIAVVVIIGLLFAAAVASTLSITWNSEPHGNPNEQRYETPPAHITLYYTNREVSVGETVYISVSYDDELASTHYLKCDWGDGSNSRVDFADTIEHIYSVLGNYSASLEVCFYSGGDEHVNRYTDLTFYVV